MLTFGFATRRFRNATDHPTITPITTDPTEVSILWLARDALRIAKKGSMDERVTVDPNVCGGKPCIRGLRIRVVDILELLASGATHEEILEDYPYLEGADIYAALRFAARQSDHPILRSTAS